MVKDDIEGSARRRVAVNIRRLLNERGMSVNKLSDFAAVNRAHLTRVLQCEADATVGWLAQVAKALGVDGSELLKETD